MNSCIPLTYPCNPSLKFINVPVFKGWLRFDLAAKGCQRLQNYLSSSQVKENNFSGTQSTVSLFFSQHLCARWRKISFLFAASTKDDDVLNISVCSACSFCGVCLCFSAFVAAYRSSNLPRSPLPPFFLPHVSCSNPYLALRASIPSVPCCRYSFY